MSRTYTWSKCPYCKKTLSFSSHWGTMPESKIGETRIITCPNCGKKVSDDNKEWPEMDTFEKAFEITRVIFLSIFGGFIFGLTIGFFLYLISGENNPVLWFKNTVIVWIIATVLLFRSSKKNIDESKKRYQERET